MYQREDLMAIYKNPPNQGRMTDPTVEVHEANPMCGDEINLQLHIERGRITQAKFTGAACFVSILASSLITEELVGKTIKSARSLDKDALLTKIDLPLTTSRIKCASLVLDALKKALDQYEKR